jgi:PII-like signaling protein
MPQSEPAKILRIHLCEGDKYEDKPLYEAIVAKCRELKMAGATVFQGLEGYGETAEIHEHHLVARDQPITIVVVDSAQAIDRLKPAVEAMMETGMIAVSDVDVVRVQKSGNAA